MKIKGLIALFLTYLVSVPLYASVDYFYLKKSDGEKVKITLQALEAMPSSSIKTSTNFTPEAVFTGVEFTSLAKEYGLTGNNVRAFAWDDYSYSMPAAELSKYKVIIAYKKNGELMDVSELGPFAIIYPRDSYPELNNIDVNAKTVWQIKMLEVK
ncbi:oxidoreductase [Serratia sp. PAMC26656]|uniref:oxidoreductase n=1 Tax=Serratia sp. PAMC26656 TaxID=2775909 RepID=UPI0018F3743B|nr:oxidoreductase [Serratia sp. PAMC26656]MBJ7894105.1 oxidoreductase [Serratia sp. PAMC26656]